MLTFEGLTTGERRQATDLVVGLIGATALELDIVIGRTVAGVWRVTVRRPVDNGPSLLPDVVREGAYADLAEVLALALTRAIN